MWETRVKKHDDAVFERSVERGMEQGMLLDKQHTLIDQITMSPL